jgi:DNA-binding CsgD family transcriptional regulator
VTAGATADVEAFSRMVASIYDAAVDPGLWPSALRVVRDFAGGQCATLFSKDVLSLTGGVFHDDGGIDPGYRQAYFDQFIRFDPASTAQYYARIGEPMATEDLVPYGEFLKTRFYREWARPQGLVDFASVALEKSSTMVAMFGVFRHERHGLVDEAMRDRLRLVAPHIGRAVGVARLLERQTSIVGDLAATLDGLRTAVLLVDASGGLRHANVAAQALLARGSVLRVDHGRLSAVSGEAEAMLTRMLGPATTGDTGLGPETVTVTLGMDGNADVVGHVLPLSPKRSLGVGLGSVLALLVSPRPLLLTSTPELVARRYGLTPAELRIFLTITKLGGIAETAAALGLRQTTVKFHLKNLYLKTGVHRQVGLVKLLADFAQPLP